MSSGCLLIGHCKRFRSTWEQLASDKASYKAFGFNIGQVDCIAHGGEYSSNHCYSVVIASPSDLCRELNVEYYPQLSLCVRLEL